MTINGKPWTRAKEVCKAVEYSQSMNHVIKVHCSRENYAQKYDLSKWSAADHLLNWPSDLRKDDYYLSEEGMYELLFSSQHPLVKKLRKHCCNVMFPHIRQQLTDKMVEKHQRAVTVLKEDIQHKDEQIVIYENRIAHLRQRYVDHAKDSGLDNIVIIVRKHTTSEEDLNFHLPCYISRIQRRKRYVKLRWLEQHFPDHEVIVEIDNPNSIHAFNRFKEEGLLSVNLTIFD